MPSYLAKTNICKNIKTSRTCKETNIKRAALWALLTSNSSIAPKTNLDCWMHGKCNYLRISLPFSNIQVIAQSSYVPYEHTITIPFNRIKNLQNATLNLTNHSIRKLEYLRRKGFKKLLYCMIAAVCTISARNTYSLNFTRLFLPIHGLSLIHIWRCRRYAVCRSRWSPYH